MIYRNMDFSLIVRDNYNSFGITTKSSQCIRPGCLCMISRQKAKVSSMWSVRVIINMWKSCSSDLYY